MKFNEYDGVVPETRGEHERAVSAKLGTLPPNICGKCCGTCDSYQDQRRGVSYCEHPRVRQMVASQQGCALWNNSEWMPVK